MAGENLIPPDAITGLMLAGGAGRRVGNQDKGTLAWQGKPLAEHCIERLAPQVARLLISCNRSREYYAQFGCELISDLRKDYQGPLAGLEAATAHCSTPFLLLAPCDTPRLPHDLGLRLAEALVQEPSANLSYAQADGREHYLCALLRRKCLPSLSAYLDSGQRAVRHWYSRQGAVAVDFPDAGDAFLNINTEPAA